MCDRLGYPRAAGSGGDAESGGSLRSVGEIGAQRAVDQVREPSFEAAEGFPAGLPSASASSARASSTVASPESREAVRAVKREVDPQNIFGVRNNVFAD